jgi:hypothetical protein
MPKSSKSKSKKSSEKGPKGWTTPEQYDWLQAQIPTYLSEKADGTCPLIMFWAEFFDGWFKRWPEESTVGKKTVPMFGCFGKTDLA